MSFGLCRKHQQHQSRVFCPAGIEATIAFLLPGWRAWGIQKSGFDQKISETACQVPQEQGTMRRNPAVIQ
jgi:hypothetical protein